MSAVILISPIVVAGWPVFAAAVASAATSLGYSELAEKATERKTALFARPKRAEVELEVPNSEVVTGQLGRDQKITVYKDGVTITFRRDERGKPTLSVCGTGYSNEDLQAMGEELSRRVIRDYVYSQIKAEIEAKQYTVIDEEIDENHSIHLTVRHWQN